MGSCMSCLEGEAVDNNQPSPYMMMEEITGQQEKNMLDLLLQDETRRRQQAEAAEKRQKELEGRGVKDPEALKRKQQRKEELEKNAQQSAGGEPNLKWTVS